MLIAGARTATPEGVLDPGWIEVDRGRIARVGTGDPPATPTHHFPGALIVPGFVDMHVHGGGGDSFTEGSEQSAAAAAAFHRRYGTTTLAASLVTARTAELERRLRMLSGLVADRVVAGVHLEGPYLHPRRRGAHREALLRTPDEGERRNLDRLLTVAPRTVRMVTLAPELDGGLDAVRAAVAAGAVAAVGHSDADYATARAAVDAGATVATHLFNAMPPLHHRAPGAAGALLEDPRVTLEVICDGVHVHPALLALVMRATGTERVALVTDAMAAAGMSDGDYLLGGQRVRVRGGVARLADGDSIAGSTLTAHAAFCRAVQDVGVPVEAAARMAATVPAEALGLRDVGQLAPGRRADLVVLGTDLRLLRVLAGGRWVEGVGT